MYGSSDFSLGIHDMEAFFNDRKASLHVTLCYHTDCSPIVSVMIYAFLPLTTIHVFDLKIG